MSGCIAVINAGSSSVEFALYDGRDELSLLFEGRWRELASHRT
jgi:hypothetical protein